MLAIEWAIGLVSCLLLGSSIAVNDRDTRFSNFDVVIFIASLVGVIWFIFRLFGWR